MRLPINSALLIPYARKMPICFSNFLSLEKARVSPGSRMILPRAKQHPRNKNNIFRSSPGVPISAFAKRDTTTTTASAFPPLLFCISWCSESLLLPPSCAAYVSGGGVLCLVPYRTYMGSPTYPLSILHISPFMARGFLASTSQGRSLCCTLSA